MHEIGDPIDQLLVANLAANTKIAKLEEALTEAIQLLLHLESRRHTTHDCLLEWKAFKEKHEELILALTFTGQ